MFSDILFVSAGDSSQLKQYFPKWSSDIEKQEWNLCSIPSGCRVRVVRKNSMDRRSSFLDALWQPEMQRVVMCTLHADMRLSEGLIAGLFRNAHKLKLVSKLN